jgi:hypothetical protein
MEDDVKYVIKSVIALLIVIAIIIFTSHSAPILDDKSNPFIVKKIKVMALGDGERSRYYGKTQKNMLMSPKPIILKNSYIIGDTIYF